ncbi:LAMI_0G17282g1_1 [Lachancea mirantina]|uniref:LAMI_0G17282g1_1 n=1 Tax=Lachancea mirantina TaxID=1230905 RepID=A0A1G4KCY5_9SACH|nr:LAMI_0G17282g1_1 [Lachancea mirantina]
MKCLDVFLRLSFVTLIALAQTTHEYNFTTGWVKANPDGMHEKNMIGFNGAWPLPDIHINKGDRVVIRLTNGLQNLKTSLHFHGLFHKVSEGNQNEMDGPEMVTQCPISPGDTYIYNFTVPDQVGTFWYHSHSGAQYTDGMRAALIIHDDGAPFEYDRDLTIQISDLYHKPYFQVMEEFLSRYNPTGAEPVPQNVLLNNTVNATINFEPNKTYLLRFLNVGNFISQYIYMEDHEFTVVEVDGVYVKPKTTNLLYIATGQRVAVLVHSQKTSSRNYALMQGMDATMLDVITPGLQLNRTTKIEYDSGSNDVSEYFIDSYKDAMNDFYLEPLDKMEILDDYDYQITLDVKMDNLGNGVNYAFFNNITYVAPKIPTLSTVLSAPEDLISNPWIYGDNINAFVLEHGEVIELVVNNYDDNRHPFHMHGHNFQIIQKSQGFDEDPVPYNESAPIEAFPGIPMRRDTVVLEANGHVVFRFVADNPGVWMFHCHVDWHLEQGLAAVFVEAPKQLRAMEQLSDNYKQVCRNSNMALKGNAAGDFRDWLNLENLPRQPAPLPEGFTLKGFLALAVSVLIGIWGLYTIVQYGFNENKQDDEELYSKLKKILHEAGQLE